MADSKLMVAIGAKTSEFEKGMDKVQSRLGGALKHAKFIGGAMVGAAVGVGAASLKMFADFDSAMRGVNTMMLLNEEEFGNLSDDVRGLAKDMGVDAVEMANALYQAISAGVPKENAIDFLRVATKAGIAGMSDTKTSVEGLTTVINAFKLPMSDAEKVADAMFTTVARGVTTFEELSAHMSLAMPIAAALNVGYEEVLATVATLTKQGVPTSQAFTQIRASMVALTKPTTEMKALIKAAGYETAEAMLATLGYHGTLEALTVAAEGNNEMLGKAFGSVEALGVVFGTTGENAEMAAADIDAMTESQGAMNDAADQMEESMPRQMAHLKAEFMDVAMTIGKALMPTLKKLVEAITPIITKIADWIAEHPELTAMILAGMAALGGLLLVLGPLLAFLPAITAALPILGVAFAALTGPIGLIIAAIIGIIAVGVLIWKNWDKIKEKAAEIWNAIKAFFEKVGEGIKTIFLNMTPVGLIIKHWDTIKEKASEIWGKIQGFFSDVGNKIKNGFISNWEETREAASRIWGKIQENSEKFGGGVKGTILGAAKTMVDEFRDFLEQMGIDTEEITNAIRNVWNSLVDFFKNIPAAIGRAFSTLKDIMLSPFRAALDAIERAINWLIDQINKISFDAPDWVPIFGGKHFGFDIPNISLPSFAAGGIVTEPTLAMLGERGPEAVVPLTGAGAAGIVINIAELVVREEADVDRIAMALERRLRTKMALQGA